MRLNMFTRLFIGALFSLCLINSPATAGWVTEAVDSAGTVGQYTSFAFDASGRPAISYYDATDGDLKFARYDGTEWVITTVDSEGNVGKYTSLAFDENDSPAISYYDATNGDLKFAVFFTSVGWLTTIVDSEGDVGKYTSLAFNFWNTPAISYYDATNGDLKFASFTTISWDITTVDSSGNVGEYTSIAFDPFGGSFPGKPGISYYDVTNGDLKFARHDGTEWVITTVDSEGDVGKYTSLAFGQPFDILFQGNPSISYYDATDGDLKFARFNGTSWDTTTINSLGDVGKHTSLAFGPSPAISCYDATNGDLKLSSFFPFIGWITTTVDFAEDVGEDTSITFDAVGNPTISYFDRTNGNLKLARFVPFLPVPLCQCPIDSPLGCISGTVREDDTGDSLTGKTVQLKRVSPRRPGVKMEFITDSDGCYQFTDLEDGRYKVKVKKCKGVGIRTVTVANGGKVNDVDFECR